MRPRGLFTSPLGMFEIPGAAPALPLLISVPHGGLAVPSEVAPYITLSPEQVRRDGDEGAGALYRGLAGRASAYLFTDVARAVVDLNRDPGDRRPDGVVKTVTSWDEAVYRAAPPERLFQGLLDRYYRPYHAHLRELGRLPVVRLGIDCHTMAATGPPVAPDPGCVRPLVCLSNGEGATCPDEWLAALGRALESRLADRSPDAGPAGDPFRPGSAGPVALNHPFRGGYITRHHSRDLPWLQLELSRGGPLSWEEKRWVVEAALEDFSREVLSLED